MRAEVEVAGPEQDEYIPVDETDVNVEIIGQE